MCSNFVFGYNSIDMRLDVYLVSNSYFSSREQAKFNIAKGNVLVNGMPASKPSQPISEQDTVSLITENAIPFASRGGMKLEKALFEFSVDCTNINALDVGASTGGFTDCLLRNGAKHVCAIDVGTNQLVASLRDDPRVVSIENMNIKDLDPSQLSPNQFDLIVADLSFISLNKVVEYLPKFLSANGQVIALIKPQFEVGQSLLGKGGIVKKPKAHIQAIESIAKHWQQANLHLSRLTYAPIHQSTKNIEYLGLFTQAWNRFPDFSSVVDEAFAAKDKVNIKLCTTLTGLSFID